MKTIKSSEPKNIIVTGGLRGIGYAIACGLTQRGDRVFIFDCAPSDDQHVSQLAGLGIEYVQVDVADAVSVKAGFEHVCVQLADQTLDGVVNNAGITRDNLAVRMSEADWDRVCAVNLKGTFLCSQQALARMVRQKKSYIINIASIVGIKGNAGQANYVASKAGVIGLTKSLAQEYAKRNVLVNAIAPGFITTPMTDVLSDQVRENILNYIPLKRFGSPEDVANLVLFLTSGRADYITGQVVEVAGGM
ncbi:MAG: 3-oxoacyl-ACP reductase FabG [Epsilonproteobacteria bacterium]|nr:3-oxoacyl-ACP reductase FabG [Campylobacterota bacterium]